MTRDELELVPERVKSGKISWQQAANDLIVFIIRNKQMFGLTKYDEDFISEIIIIFLDRCISAFNSYDKKKGTFFAYLYCFVANICNSIKKERITRKIIEHHNINESISDYFSKIQDYENISYTDLERPKIPYKYTPVSYKDFQIACKTDSYRIKEIVDSDKSYIEKTIKEKLKTYSPLMVEHIILVLALKSAYYLTEEQIEKISDMFHIDSTKFHQIVLDLKQGLESRKRNRTILEERRNRAYYLHTKTRNQIEWNKETKNDSDYSNLVLRKSYQKNTANWKNLNTQLEEGKILIRPTTKLIAQILGISARQVTYYQTTARKLGIDISKV